MADVFPNRPVLAVGSTGRYASGLWGAVFLLLSESTIFAYLFFSYFYFSSQPQNGPWPPDGPPNWFYPGLQTAVVLLGCLSAWWSDRSARRGASGGMLGGLAATLILAIGFTVLQLLDWADKSFGFATDAYSSFYYVIGGFHLAHVVVGVVILAVVLLWSALGYFGPRRHVPVTVAAYYWYFVAIIWLGVLFTLDITPYMGWQPHPGA